MSQQSIRLNTQPYVLVLGDKKYRAAFHRTFKVGDPLRLDGTNCVVCQIDTRQAPTKVYLRVSHV